MGGSVGERLMGWVGYGRFILLMRSPGLKIYYIWDGKNHLTILTSPLQFFPICFKPHIFQVPSHLQANTMD